MVILPLSSAGEAALPDTDRLRLLSSKACSVSPEAALRSIALPVVVTPWNATRLKRLLELIERALPEACQLN